MAAAVSSMTSYELRIQHHNGIHTVLDLQLGHPNRCQNVVLSGLLRFLEVTHSVAGRPLSMTYTTSTDVAIAQDAFDISELDGALGKFEGLREEDQIPS